MFKSIFSKLITIFILILIIAFSITGVMLYVFLDEFTTREKAALLERGSNSVDIAFSYYLEIRKAYGSAADLISEKNLKASLVDFGNSTQSIIWIVDDKGRLFRSNWDIPQAIIDKYADKSGNLVIPENKQFAKLSAQEATVSEIGDFSGFFKDPIFGDVGDLWLTVGKSFTYYDNQGNDKMIIVYMNTPVGGVRQARVEVFKNFLFSMGIAIVIAALLIYIFSLRITRPLKQIRNAAAKISNGEFGRRLDIKSQDEIGELAKTFNQMAAALQNLEEMRRGFIANVSHELRSPLASVQGFIQGMLDGAIEDADRDKYLQIVLGETKRMSSLINDLLSLAKIESGKFPIEYSEFDINELLRRCLLTFEQRIEEKNIGVVVGLSEEKLNVWADEDRISQVITNLIDNAVKFTGEGGELKVWTFTTENKVHVNISDTGVGIPQEDQPYVFERFFKVDKAHSPGTSGTGIGLSIVKRIIAQHGETIGLQSEEGKGTTFSFTLTRSLVTPEHKGRAK